MEIRINKEIKDYHESLFFGLSARQFICSVIAVGTAAGTYFGLKSILSKETVSWLCVVCSSPVAVAGFFKYNGMKFEEFVWAWFCSEFLASGVRKFESENHLYNIYMEAINDVAVRKTQKNKKTKAKDTQNDTAVNTD